MEHKFLIHLFLKFGREQDITDLYYNGTIFMNPIQKFREFEDDELRGDPYEGVTEIKNLKKGTIEFPSIGFKGTYNHAHWKSSYENISGNIYSLYCLSSNLGENINSFAIDNKIKKFGSHCLIIKDTKAFLERIIERLKQMEIDFQQGLVEYYDKNEINSYISLFEKPSDFSYQNEFRFYAKNSLKEPIKFSIGSLADISEIYPSDTVVDTLSIEVI